MNQYPQYSPAISDVLCVLERVQLDGKDTALGESSGDIEQARRIISTHKPAHRVPLLCYQVLQMNRLRPKLFEVENNQCESGSPLRFVNC
jgi:hypothetical protein